MVASANTTNSNYRSNAEMFFIYLYLLDKQIHP